MEKIQKELLDMFKEDQKMRAKNSYDIKVDKRNVKRLNQIIIKYGWPSSVGKKAENAAWLIAQHADFNIRFQEKCLKLIQKLPKTKERKSFVAYLTDRIAVNKKRKQTYGTQFHQGRDGKLKPRPIKDIKNLEKRRKEIGLESFNKYKKKMEKLA